MKCIYMGFAIYIAVTFSQGSTSKTLQNNPVPVATRHTPYFQMTQEQQAAFVRKAHEIKLGDTRVSVETLLGAPDLDIVDVKKKTPTRPTGRSVRYYVIWYEKVSVNEIEDRRVTFRFDATDHLVRIESNVPGIQSRPLFWPMQPRQ